MTYTLWPILQMVLVLQRSWNRLVSLPSNCSHIKLKAKRYIDGIFSVKHITEYCKRSLTREEMWTKVVWIIRVLISRQLKWCQLWEYQRESFVSWVSPAVLLMNAVVVCGWTPKKYIKHFKSQCFKYFSGSSDTNHDSLL